MSVIYVSQSKIYSLSFIHIPSATLGTTDALVNKQSDLLHDFFYLLMSQKTNKHQFLSVKAVLNKKRDIKENQAI